MEVFYTAEVNVWKDYDKLPYSVRFSKKLAKQKKKSMEGGKYKKKKKGENSILRIFKTTWYIKSRTHTVCKRERGSLKDYSTFMEKY